MECLSNTDLTNLTSIGSNETDLATSTNAEEFSVFAEFQGQELSISEVFVTLFVGLVHVALFGSAQLVQDVKVQHSTTQMDLVYEHHGASRTPPPFLIYQTAARAL